MTIVERNRDGLVSRPASALHGGGGAIPEAGGTSARTLLRVEWRPLAELVGIADAWNALAARALEPNVFYEPAFALAAAPVFGADAGALLVWSNAAENELVGLFPGRVERRRFGVVLPVLVGWTHPYAPLGAPLIDRDIPERVLAAALDFVAHEPSLPDLLLLPFAPAAGPFAFALAATLLERNGCATRFGQHARALLNPSLKRNDYLRDGLAGKKRKELRRQARRLAEFGPVCVVSASEPSRINEALDAFMAIEAAGWKGRAKGAASLDPQVAQFMRRAVQGLCAVGQARIDRLMLGGRPIAAAIVLRSGSAAWFWKIAYDEALARASPGVQLALELTQSLLADATIEKTDSCATPEHPMIDHLWRERLSLADHLVAVGPATGAHFALACRLEGVRRRAIGAAKWLRSRLPGR